VLEGASGILFCMKTSKKETRENLARTPAKLLNALVELANLRDDEAAFKWFANRWPDIARVLDRDQLDDGRTKFVGFDQYERRDRMPPKIPKRFLQTWQQRQVLREIWGGNSKRLTDVLLPPPDEALYFPDPDHPWPPQLKVDWRRGEFVYIPRSEFQEAVYKLFRSSNLAKVCANPDCPTPYFIAGRTTQQYCSEKCSGVLQRANKLRWWKEHGPEWRRKRSRRKRGKG
jgi:hypothetical protein